MTAAASFKSLTKDGVLLRGDIHRARLDDLKVEPGFNLRAEGPDLDAHVEAIAAHILDGGQLPPLEVRVADNGDILVVDGHCRRRGYLLARERGAPIDLVNVLPFRGNDADRVARIISSAAGRPLTQLETAMGYKRLSAFNLTPEQIGAKFSKTRQHVDQLLILANANHDVHQLVASGAVSATVAIDAVRKHGEGAGAFLAGQLAKAQDKGKAKVTAGGISGKKLPPKITGAVVETADVLVGALTVSQHEVIARARSGAVAQTTVLEICVGDLLPLLDAYEDVRKAREKIAAK